MSRIEVPLAQFAPDAGYGAIMPLHHCVTEAAASGVKRPESDADRTPRKGVRIFHTHYRDLHAALILLIYCKYLFNLTKYNMLRKHY
jgi:hypothetical protein